MRENNTKRQYTINDKQNNKDIVNESDNFTSLLNNLVIERDNEPQIMTVCRYLFMVGEHVIYAENEKSLYMDDQPLQLSLQTQCTPENHSKSTILPFVISYKKTFKSFNNYRDISIIPVFTKSIEYIILLKCTRITESHHLQYGYKELSPTLHAEFLIKGTIQYYNKNDSPIYIYYICGLDAEKAFDSCNWDILFEKIHYEK